MLEQHREGGHIFSCTGLTSAALLDINLRITLPSDPCQPAAAGSGIFTLVWPKLIQTHSVDLIILVGCFHSLFVNPVTSEMGRGGRKTLYPGLSTQQKQRDNQASQLERGAQ